MRRIVFLVMAVLVGLTGCSSSKSGPAAGRVTPPVAAVPTSAAATSSGSPTAATSATATSAGPSPVPVKPNLKKQVLALTDLPAGWSVNKSASSNDNKDDPACFKSVENDKSKPAGKASVSYQGSPDGLPSLEEDLAYGSEKQAISELAQAKKALDKCGAISIPTKSVTLKGTMSPMSFPTLGDGSVAYQIVLTAVVGTTRVAAGMDLVLFRSGNEEGTVFYATLGTPDIAGFEAISKLAVSKTRDAGGVLS